MKIKYGELPPRSVCDKLVMVSFDSPRKNLSVFKFCTEVMKHLAYVENEKNKLARRYGVQSKDNPFLYTIEPNTENAKEYWKRLNDAMSMEIDGELPELSLSEDDFMDENCQYPPDKTKWMNASDVATVFAFIKK